MNLKTYRAPTMAAALTLVKGEMGHDAVILHTRTFFTRHWMGLRRREMVEITAGKGLNVGARGAGGGRRAPQRPPQQQPEQPQLPAQPSGGGGGGGLAAYRRSTVQTAGSGDAPRNPIEGGRQFMETTAAGNVAMVGLSNEMKELRTMVKVLVDEQRHQKCPQVPEDLFEYYMQLTSNQVAQELASDIVKTLKSSVRPEHLAQPAYIRERLADQLEKLLPTAGPIVRTRTSGPHIVALVGPTGVGKTTTIAKLAANLKLREKHRVGLITLDTYRIAAVDQLKKYADIIGSPLRVVASADELRDAVRFMADCDFVLIDTAGRSPNDTMKLNELRGLLAAAEPDEVHLVLSSTSSEQCVQLAVSRFSEVGFDKIIFTKLDEAAHVGMLLNVVRKVNKSLSYITTGQDVPDDIEVGRGRRLAEMILSNAGA